LTDEVENGPWWPRNANRAAARIVQRDGLTQREAFLQIHHKARRQRLTMVQMTEEIPGSDSR
jgi:AmiR/NasT family two-component response regulator